METTMLEEGKLEETNDACTLPSQVDLLIVGYGPVGATLAALAGRYGMSTLVIDKAPGMLDMPRAIGMDNDGLRVLQMAGVTEDAFPTRAMHHLGLESRFAGRFGHFNCAGVVDGHAKFVTYYQPDLERALRDVADGHACVHSAQCTELVDYSEDTDGITARLIRAPGQPFEVRTRFLVGADGANSRVRELIGAELEGKSYPESWLVVDVKDPPRPVEFPGFVSNPERPCVVIPAPGGRQRWEFMLHEHEDPEVMKQPERVQELLAPWADSKILSVERLAVYQFRARCCESFQKGRVFLAGDAAHVTPPFIGQGLVSGLRDAANLIWKLDWVLRGQAGPEILDSYTVERQPHAKAMIDLARVVGILVMPPNGVKAFIGHNLVRLLRMMGPFGRFIDDLGFKPKNAYRKGLFEAGRGRLKRGASFPQGWVRGADGRVVLSDEMLGDGMTLVGFGRDARDFLSASEIADWQTRGGRFAQVTMRAQLSACSEDAFEDVTGQLLIEAAPFGWAAVVRPDRIVLTDGQVTDSASMMRDVTRRLGAPAQSAAGASAASMSGRGRVATASASDCSMPSSMSA